MWDLLDHVTDERTPRQTALTGHDIYGPQRGNGDLHWGRGGGGANDLIRLGRGLFERPYLIKI